MCAVRAFVIVFSSMLILFGMRSAVIAGPPARVLFDAGHIIRSGKIKLPQSMPGLHGSFHAYASEAVVGDNRTWLATDYVTGEYYFKEFALRAAGTACEVWVATDLNWLEGDNRTEPVIEDEQLEYLVEEFETTIIPTNTEAFGAYDDHDGSEAFLSETGDVSPGYYSGDKLVILVDNIMDYSYYDPEYPIFIGGFFSPTLEYFFDRNVITITARYWEDMLGPDISSWRGDDPDLWRTHLIDATIAHELQHLIHSDLDDNETAWVDEGMAMLSEWLCGYELDPFYIEAVEERPENSLVSWGDQGDREIITDYGLSLLWTLYLHEQYGGDDFTRSLARNKLNGIAGVNATLKAYGFNRTFADTYRDFRIALLIDSDNATTLPPNISAFVDNSPHPYLIEAVDVSINVDSDNASATEGAPAWGADYLKLSDVQPLELFRFNGKDQLTYDTGWTVAADPVSGDNATVLWGGAKNDSTSWAIIEVEGGGMLTFDTYYAIEEGWDFAFVQVSIDRGVSWTTHAVDNATMEHDPNASTEIIANLPGLTGTSAEWVSVSVDLSAYADSDILIAFRYMTDWATVDEGWFIDNIRLDGKILSDGTGIDLFKDITAYVPVPADYSVALVGAIQQGEKRQYIIRNIAVNKQTNDAATFMGRLGELDGYVVGVVSLEVDEEHGDLYGGYTCSIENPFGVK